MEQLEVRGTIVELGETQEFGQKGFAKRGFVIEEVDDRGYKNQYPFELHRLKDRDNTTKLDNAQVGQQVEVKFNIRSNEYNGKHYVNLVAWFVKVDGSADVRRPIEDQYAPQLPAAIDPAVSDPTDGIPF